MQDYENHHVNFSETHKNFSLFGIEFDPDGIPTVRIQRTVGNPANLIAGYELLERMIASAREELIKKLDSYSQKIDAANSESKIESPIPPAVPKNADDLMNMLKNRMNELQKSREKQKSSDTTDNPKVDEVINLLKDQFGFDGESGDLNIEGRFSIEGGMLDDDD